MPPLRWLPWKFIVRRLARTHGFLDPIAVLSYVRRFSQPSEVTEPIELLRAGVVFHARGLINSRAIQQNLDWIWPYWISRQFDPNDKAFIPRAFSLTHVNLTHRNWTATGLPGGENTPLVDPRGLLTPHHDSWSLDFWLIDHDGKTLFPSRLETVHQTLNLDNQLTIQTRAEKNDLTLESHIDVTADAQIQLCRARLTAHASHGGHLIVSLRPCNPEGISFIHNLKFTGRRWRINRKYTVTFDQQPERHRICSYNEGDVALSLFKEDSRDHISCNIGMITAAAIFQIQPSIEKHLQLTIPLKTQTPKTSNAPIPPIDWRQTPDFCPLQIPDQKAQFIFDAAKKALLLHSADNVYPGPYTYKRFWFRDAAFILHAMLCAGMILQVRRVIENFGYRQLSNGYFQSQQGEWDSNGQAIWIIRRFCELTNEPPDKHWLSWVKRGAKWIIHKRLTHVTGSAHAGLLPAGFSAEHLGPNDFYYWDDFWGVEGLYSAAALYETAGELKLANSFRTNARNFFADIEKSLYHVEKRLKQPIMPASCYRRMDSGAIGSIVAGYPLQLLSPTDPHLVNTVEYLLGNCLVKGGFFQDMIHSGINAYLTLHLAQVLTAAGDGRAAQLINVVRDLATDTGQWPEAIHPATKGGCMGDGQHVWACAEWLLMIRNCFLLEDHRQNKLILAAGIPRHWLKPGSRLSIGPAPTKFGSVILDIDCRPNETAVSWQGQWFTAEPDIEVRLTGRTKHPQKGQDTVTFTTKETL